MKIHSNNGYIHLEDLPHNCIFNKVVTGCGATTIALYNGEDYVIAVPYTELITNKTGLTEAGVSRCTFNGVTREVFALFGEKKDAEGKLISYLATDGVKKIISTYDKIPFLIEHLEPSKYRLLIDEYHTLLKAYSYRQKAVDGVLNNFRRFKSFCFMSATPLRPTFQPSCLDGVPYEEAEWDRVDTMHVDLMPTNKPYAFVKNIINEYVRKGYCEYNGIKSYEVFFFLNSVTDIANIVKDSSLRPNLVRIICADKETNQKKLAGYNIENSRSKNKMINFITSKSFEGADYFSDTGLCVVVSTKHCEYTQANIDTDIPQIAGRIRTKSNPFRNILVHICSKTNRPQDITKEEMEQKVEENINKAIETVAFFNSANGNVRDDLRIKLKDKMNALYMRYDDMNDCFVLNDILPKLEMYNWELHRIIYSSGVALASSYQESGIDCNTTYIICNDSVKSFVHRASFKELFLRYVELKGNLYYMGDETDTIAQQEPLVKEAYEKLGSDEVKKLKYVKKAINDRLINEDTTLNRNNKIAQLLSGRINEGFISSSDLSRLIGWAYSQVGETAKPTASHLEKWYECKKTTKRVAGKPTSGYIVYRPKFVFK